MWDLNQKLFEDKILVLERKHLGEGKSQIHRTFYAIRQDHCSYISIGFVREQMLTPPTLNLCINSMPTRLVNFICFFTSPANSHGLAAHGLDLTVTDGLHCFLHSNITKVVLNPKLFKIKVKVSYELSKHSNLY